MREQSPGDAGRYEKSIREVGTNPGEPDTVPSKLRATYAEFIAAAEAKHFEMIQPAMALLPWLRNRSRDNADPGQKVLPFVPIPEDANIARQLRQSFIEAYERYVKFSVLPFAYQLSTSRVQVVLVDVLRVLSNGRESYNDTRKCLESTLKAYRYARRWFKKRIRRVVFAATKADHALKGDRSNLSRLLETLVERARAAVGGDLAPSYRWLASLQATSDSLDRRNERPQEALTGRLDGESEASSWNPGIVPEEWPDRVIPLTDEPWIADNDFYRFPRFAPPRFPARDGAPLPHLNLDELLWEILEPCFVHQARGAIDARA
jgi:hypothetical protein